VSGPPEVLVIGAGVGGLAAAVRLAAGGHRVHVLEQAAAVGGKLGLHEQAGYRFDTGPSLLTMPWALAEVLTAGGAALEDVLDLRRLDPIARYRFADGTWLDAAADGAGFSARLEEAFGAGSGVQWEALMDRAADVWRAAAEPVLMRALRGPRDLLPLARDLADLRAVAPHRSLRSLGREHLSDPRLRMLLDRYATYAGSDPRRAPAALVTIPYVERRWGGWYVQGGLRCIADVLADRLVALGGRITTGTRVRRILIRDGRVAGVRLDGGDRLAADVVVVNADAAQVAGDLLPRPTPAALRRRLRVAPRSLAGWVLLLGVDASRLTGRAARMAHHTVLFPADYDAEFDALFPRRAARRRGAPRYVDDPTVYISVPRDPAVAPPGHEAWFVLVNAPRTDQVAAPPVGYADHVLALMAARGIDVRGAVTVRVERSPADLERDTLTPGGAIYGTSSNGPLAAFLRPPNVTGIGGLHLVGGSSHPGGGLPLVLLSAAIVAREIGPAPHPQI
jgi:phytoene desaturase